MISILFPIITGDELSQLMDNRKSPDNISSELNMEITNKKGRKRKSKIRSISKDNNSKQILISCKQRPTVQRMLNHQARHKKNIVLYQQEPSLVFPSLFIPHQHDNAKLAAHTLQILSPTYQFQFQDIVRHIANTSWPGRIQTIQKHPDILFDVAHNQHSIRAFIKYFQDIRIHYKRSFLIIGIENEKRIKPELPQLYQQFHYIDFTETKIRNSMSADLLFNLYILLN